MDDENDASNKKPYKIKDITRANCKGIVAGSLEEVKTKSAEKFGRTDMPNIHLDSDGTEIDDEDYFQTLEPNAELVAVFGGEQWIDPTRYVTITARRNSSDTTDSADVERVNLKKIVSQLKNNLYNVSVLSEPDLEMLTNMDPNSVADITGKDFIEQLKEVSGRFLHEKREALDAIELLKIFAKHKGVSFDVEPNETTPSDPTQPQKPQQQQQQQRELTEQQPHQQSLLSNEVTSQQPSSSGCKWPGNKSVIDTASMADNSGSPFDYDADSNDDNRVAKQEQQHLATCPMSGQQQIQNNDI